MAAALKEIASCSICYENLVWPQPDGETTSILALHCGHVYHRVCITELIRIHKDEIEKENLARAQNRPPLPPIAGKLQFFCFILLSVYS